MKKLFKYLLLVLFVFIITGCGKELSEIEKIEKKENIKITLSETKKIEYDDYDNGLVSLKIPKGWKVEVAKTDYIHYSFKVFKSDDKDYMFLFGMKQEGFLKTENARKTYAKYYPKSVFAKLQAVNPQTAEGFYKVWNKNAKYSNKSELKTNYFPIFDGFKVIDKLGKTQLGGDILRATFKNSKGKKMQGLFTATVKSSGKYYINTNIFNLNSKKVDVAPLNVYNIILMTAPDEEFNNYQPILDHCISTIKFSDKFIKGFNKEEANLVKTIKANQQIYDSISDMIMDSWNKRNNSYDIISQKQSDATLGYERVYDTQTNEVYRAYNGFTDNYKGDRYQVVTDNMYTSPISGYIEK